MIINARMILIGIKYSKFKLIIHYFFIFLKNKKSVRKKKEIKKKMEF